MNKLSVVPKNTQLVDHSRIRARIFLLGKIRVENLDGGDITPRSVKACALLAYLLLAYRGSASRRALAAMLWSRHADSQALTSLRQSLVQLRAVFSELSPQLFQAYRRNVQLDIGQLWVDAFELEKAPYLNSHNHFPPLIYKHASSQPLSALDECDPALNVWLRTERVRLLGLLIESLQSLLRNVLADNDYMQAQKFAQQLVDIDPLCEVGHHVLIWLHAEQGNQAAALHHYQMFQTNLQQVLSLQPSPVLQQLADNIQQQSFDSQRDMPFNTDASTPVVSEDKPPHKPQGSVAQDFVCDDLLGEYKVATIRKVEAFWVEGVLERSLYAHSLIDLGLRYTPDALIQPWDLIVQKVGHAPQRIPGSKRILETFRACNESILVLGAPGSGKTTLLLDLVRQLIADTKNGVSTQLPVVFHLSTWANKRLSLRDWLLDELDKRYDIPVKIGRQLIDKNIVLLLDGLDEVDSEYRDACIEAINAFRRDSPLTPMLVCCREHDYQDLSSRLNLHAAVSIHPLSYEHLLEYLQQHADVFVALLAALDEDPGLAEVLTTPLMFSIAVLVYQQYPDYKPPTHVECSDRRQQLFAMYVDIMFKRRNNRQCYNEKESVRWLSWLAKTLARKNQTIFHLEWMQADWLSSAVQQRIVTVGSVTVLGVLVAVILAVFSVVQFESLTGAWIALGFGLVGGLGTGFAGYGDEIRPITRVRFSWSVLKKHFIRKLLAALSIGVFHGAGISFVVNPGVGLAAAVITALGFIGFGAIDFDYIKVNADSIQSPNEGVRLSLKHALLGFVFGGVIGMLIGGLVEGWQGAILCGLIFGTIFSMFVGTLTCVQHFLLRFLLWRNRDAPWRYTKFLQYAVERIFLYRVGGGYIFIHRSLLEYFVGLPEE